MINRLSALLAYLFAPDLIRARAERDAALRKLAGIEEQHRRLLDACRDYLSIPPVPIDGKQEKS